MSGVRMNMNFNQNNRTSQQTRQQTSQQNLRMGSTTRRVCAALYVQGNKTCGTCGSRGK